MRRKSGLRAVLLAMMGAMMMTNAIAQEPAETQNPTTLSETYDAWTVKCFNIAEGEQTRRRCQMSQELIRRETRQRALLFALVTEGKDSAKATLIMPFGLLLPEGFRIEVDGKELARSAYRTCLPAGCIAELDLPTKAIDQLKAGNTASVFMTANSGQLMKTEVSLKGFSAAYRRLVALTVG